MRPYTLTSDMDFRVIPLAIPLQSPSPDKKIVNMIAPTLSPNTIDIKKGWTSLKNPQGQKQNNKSIYEAQTQHKYNSYPGIEYRSAIKQKDEQIKKLKNIINKITESGRGKKDNEYIEDQLKNQVKVLTIQNQKLFSAIEKLKRDKNSSENIHIVAEQYERRIQQLSKRFRENQKYHEQSQKELKRFIKNLNAQFKNLEIEKKQFENENTKLIKILKEKNDGQKKNDDSKLRISDASEQQSEEKSQNLTKNQSKLTLVKIREQHSQNLKVLKEGLIKQIEQTFDTMKIALEGINIKIKGFSRRLESLEKIAWSRVKKTQIQTQSITISIQEGSSAVENQQETDRSFKIEKKNNSQIYIEQGVSSQHEKASRDEFSRLEEVPSQKSLIHTLQDQLTQTKAQLDQIRFKYQKICLDTSSLVIPKEVPIKEKNELIEISQNYRNSLKEIEQKDKEIQFLYDEIRRISIQNLEELEKKDVIVKQKRKQIQQLKNHHELKINQMQFKVKLLVENYQKEIQLLKHQINTKSNLLSGASEQSQIEKQESHKRLQKIEQQLIVKQEQNRKIQSSYVDLKRQYENDKSVWLNLQKHMQNQMKFIKENIQVERKQKEQINQQLMFQISELNQLKSLNSTLKSQFNATKQQLNGITVENTEIKQTTKKLDEENHNLRKTINQKDQAIMKLRQGMAEWSNSSILGQIDEIKTLIQGGNITISSNLQNIQQNKLQQQLSVKIDQIAQLRKTNQFLRQQLQQRQKAIIQLQSKLFEIEKNNQLSISKLSQQYNLYSELVEKFAILQKQRAIITEQKQYKIKKSEQEIEQYQSITSKLTEIRTQQQQRFQNLRRLLEQNTFTISC